MVTKNDDLKSRIREAYRNKDANAFNQWVMMLLHRGYATRLGPRGGIWFVWIGVGSITELARIAIAREFASYFGKEVKA